jgi:hypothetical protein
MIKQRQCDYCNDQLTGNGDGYRLLSGKTECWRCRYYFKDKAGHWQMKRRFAFPGKFIDDGTGHWVLNPDYVKQKKKKEDGEEVT